MKDRKPKEMLNGNHIQELLEIKGMTRNELAILVGTDNSHISRIINNKVKCISLPIAIKIAQALQEPVENVFIFKFQFKQY